VTATDSENIAVANFIASRGNKIGVHEGDPGKTDANRIGNVEGSTSWGSAAMGSGDTAGFAVVSGGGVTLAIPAGKTVSHFSIRGSDGSFLRGYPLSNPITVGGTGTVSVIVNPTILHKG